MSGAATIASPCVNVCRLDERRLCIGCRRSIEEITAWGRLDDEGRRRVLRAVAERERAGR